MMVSDRALPCCCVVAVVALVTMSVACRAGPPEGVFACTTSDSCPPGQNCIDGVCWSYRPGADAAVVEQQEEPDAASVQSAGSSGMDGDGAAAAEPTAGMDSQRAGAGSPAARSAGVGGATPAIPRDYCFVGACSPGGKCVSGSKDYYCECLPGFSSTGPKGCMNVDDCLATSCKPGGTCIDEVSTYKCMCDKGYSGTGTRNCTNINDCPASACMPGGRCVDAVGTYSCLCDAGYSGSGTQSCKNIDECASNPCAPGGTCKDAVNDYACTCTGGFKGPDEHHCPFKDNGDGTITDATSGIVWQKEYSTQPVDTEMAFCARLMLKGAGWRLPKDDEVSGTVNLWPDPPLCIKTAENHCFLNFTADRGPANTSGLPHVVRCVR